MSASFVDSLFDPVASLVANGVGSSMDSKPAEVLLGLDRDRAIELLVSSSILNSETGDLDGILNVLNQHGVKVPHAVLHPVMERIRSSTDYRGTRAYSNALVADALNPDEETEARLLGELDHVDPDVHTGAAWGLLLQNELSPRWRLQGIRQTVGYDGMTVPQKVFEHLADYDWQVENCGHEGFFRETSGARYALVLRGLREGGDGERAEVLEEMLTLFSAEGPAEDHDVRRRQVAAILRDHQSAVEALDEKTQSADRCIFVAQALFALRYSEDFRPVD